MVTDRVKARNKRLLKTYGITVEIYDRILLEQGGGCAICGKEAKPGKNLHVDHVHIKGGGGPVRGILCWFCNRKRIGREKDPRIFDACAAYLRKPHTGYFTPLKKRKRRKKRGKRNR